MTPQVKERLSVIKSPRGGGGTPVAHGLLWPTERRNDGNQEVSVVRFINI